MRLRLWLADELFLTAHDDRTGRARQASRGVGLGLGAALLGELMLFGQIVTQDGLVTVVDRRAPVDALAHTVLDQVMAEGQRLSLRTWIAFLGQTAVEQVAGRLERSGVLRREESRRLFRSEVRWAPSDSTTAATPGLLLRHQLLHEKPLAVPDVVLAGLVDATGLGPLVLWGMTSRMAQYRDWCVANLTPSLRELIAETDSVVGRAVLIHRA